MKIQSTGYWTFICNPAKWEIDKFLETNIEYDTYQISDWQKDFFHIGQLGVIRVGIDKRSVKILNRRKKLFPGIYAIVQVLSEPDYRGEKPDKFWVNWSEKELDKPVVRIRYLKNLLNSPLLLKDIKNDAQIQSDKYLLNGFQASSIPLKKETFERIIELVGNSDQIFENVESENTFSVSEIAKLEQKYKDASPQVKEVLSKRIERGNISKELKKINNYKCQVCETLGLNPLTFQKTNKEYYVETHHVIPVSKLEEGSLAFGNLITICANHHRQMHYGNVELIENTNQCLRFRIDNKEITIQKKLKI